MPDKFDSGYAVVPVAHPTEGIQNIAVPEGVSMDDLHRALMNADYSHPMAEKFQPTAEGALENSDRFRQAASQAWDKSVRGSLPTRETGFSVGYNGKAGDVLVKDTPKGQIPDLNIPSSPFAMGTVHTHPNAYSQQPSAQDIAENVKSKKPVWMVSSAGLFSVENGKVTQIHQGTDWLKPKKQ